MKIRTILRGSKDKVRAIKWANNYLNKQPLKKLQQESFLELFMTGSCQVAFTEDKGNWNYSVVNKLFNGDWDTKIPIEVIE